MRFGVLGPLAVWTDGGAEVTVPGTTVRALLADLVVHRGTLRTTDQLVEDLWGREPPGNPLGALQATVSRLRRALEDAEPGARDLVVSRGPGYLLDVPASSVDAERFAHLADPAAREPPSAEAATGLGEALALWRGPALADVADAAFAGPVVTELTEQWLAATEAYLDVRSALGEDDAAVTELTTLAGRHPLRERLHATLMRALYRAGRQADALRRYEDLRAALADELGVDPSPEVAALHGAILRQEPGLARASAAGPARGSPATNLPVPWDETVGREDEVAGLRAALGAARLVTVVGPGGVGKTRVALEAARAMGDEVPGGVWLVDLAGLDGGAPGESVADAVADSLGLRDDAPDRAGAPRAVRVAGALRERDLVLVLDNCEHVVDAAADLVAALLRAAPRVRVLATSREPLGLRGEQLRPIATLGLPGPDDDPTTSPAVRLFTARAASADPAFALTPATAATVAAVCRRLDGLPLALELAAARVRTLGLHEVAARLDDRFALLDSGPRDAPERQRTLRAVMDWSWEPLAGAERAVLRRLAVTGGGAGADLVEAVCAGDPVPDGAATSLVARLVDRSLLTVADTGDGTRWRMLETVAAYAAERLRESGEADAVAGRHARACAELVDRAGPALRGADQATWLARLDREGANVRLALDTAIAAGDAGLALRIVVAASGFWHLRGRRGTARRSLERALAVPGGDPLARADATAALAAVVIRERDVDDPVAHSRAALAAYDGLDAPLALAHARRNHADALGGGGRLADCEELMAAALATFREAGDHWGVAAVRSEQGFYEVMRGRLDEARAAAAEAAALLEDVGDLWVRSQLAALEGQLDEIVGDYASATRRHREGLAAAEELRLWPAVIDHHNRLGRLALLVGEHDDADAHHRRAFDLAREHGHVPATTFARLGLGMTARRRGRFAEAAEHLEAVRAEHGDSGYEPGTAITFAELGFLAEQRGDTDEARRRHRAGREIAERSGDPRAVALALEGLAGVAVLDGDPDTAAALLGAAAARRDDAGAPLPAAESGDVDRIVAAARDALGGEAFAAGWARGRADDSSAVSNV